MGINVVPEITFTKNDPSLIEEAVRRVAAVPGSGGDRVRIAAAVRVEAARGTRVTFGLLKAGARAAKHSAAHRHRERGEAARSGAASGRSGGGLRRDGAPRNGFASPPARSGNGTRSGIRSLAIEYAVRIAKCRRHERPVLRLRGARLPSARDRRRGGAGVSQSYSLFRDGQLRSRRELSSIRSCSLGSFRPLLLKPSRPLTTACVVNPGLPSSSTTRAGSPSPVWMLRSAPA